MLLKSWRNRLLANPQFIEFAQRFLLTRPIARRRSIELFDIVAGFAYSQVLYTAARLQLFTLIGSDGIQTVDLEQKIGWDAARCATFFRAAKALQLIEIHGEKITLGIHGAALLGQPWILRFILHHEHFYKDLEDPVGLLSGAEPGEHLSKYWSYNNGIADKSEYTALMAESQKAVSAEVLAAYDFASHGKVLDIGGGNGAFLRALRQKHPRIDAHLFDLPGVIALAEGELTRHPGHFLHDPLPHGADLVTLIRVVHDHNDPEILALFRRIRAISSTLLIAEPFSGTASTARVTDAYFNLYFTAMGQGRTRTPDEIVALAKQVGFTRARQLKTRNPLITGALLFI